MSYNHKQDIGYFMHYSLSNVTSSMKKTALNSKLNRGW